MRDCIWSKLGLFQLKQKVKQKMYFRKAAREDAKCRKVIAKEIMSLPDGMLQLRDGINIIVSMTSYGYRVESSSPYALYSILKQTRLPNRIVLNIDKNKWNDENIPALLKKLQRVGVEVNYTEDIGPHTKFIPALKKYPDDIIITADDDVFYDSVMIEELYSSYELSDKKSVVCREGKYIIRKEGKILPYSQLPDLFSKCDSKQIMPFGVAGVLYPPHIFGDEIFKIEAIKELAPKADDIWFCAMELYYGITAIKAKTNWQENKVIDRNEEYNASVSGALYMSNDLEGQNDVQWAAVIRHYHL